MGVLQSKNPVLVVTFVKAVKAVIAATPARGATFAKAATLARGPAKAVIVVNATMKVVKALVRIAKVQLVRLARGPAKAVIVVTFVTHIVTVMMEIVIGAIPQMRAEETATRAWMELNAPNKLK